ncbi:unnamed protein product [Linum tenue]|uniref:Uncharacterized protein n=1 Tax=Linum tenue TaxID=586396 RepID=A0AAV0NAT1_9ROSI|nr:unnamed protein product [Linum tenue]
MPSGDEEKIRRFSSLERSPEKVNLGGRKILVWLAGGFLGQSLLMEKRRARSKFFHISVDLSGLRTGFGEVQRVGSKMRHIPRFYFAFRKREETETPRRNSAAAKAGTKDEELLANKVGNTAFFQLKTWFAMRL